MSAGMHQLLVLASSSTRCDQVISALYCLNALEIQIEIQIALRPTRDLKKASLYDLLEAAGHFDGKPAPRCNAISTSTREANFKKRPDLVLESVVPVPGLVEQLSRVIEPELRNILVPANSQFVAIVHPASTTLPFKRLHRLEKDNESQFEQENLSPVLKIMAYHVAYVQPKKETGTKPRYAAVFKRWASSDFQKSSVKFSASSPKAKKNITDFGIYSSMSVDANSADSFTIKAVVEVKTTKVLTDEIFGNITGWYEVGGQEYVPGMAIQYVWPDKAPRNSDNDAGGAGDAIQRTQDKILRQIWGQLWEEKAEYAVLTSAFSSYYFYRRLDGSGTLYISPPYETSDNMALYAWREQNLVERAVSKF